MTQPGSDTLSVASGDWRAQIRTVAERYWRQAQQRYPRQLAKQPLPELRFDLTGASAGQVVFSRRRQPLAIRFNLDIATHNPHSFVATTVAHELAHVIAVLLHGRGALGHGRHWRDIMTEFGQPARRCHQYDLSAVRVRRQRRYTYHCACDSQCQLSTTRHRRQQRGERTYYCTRCRTPLRPGSGNNEPDATIS